MPNHNPLLGLKEREREELIVLAEESTDERYGHEPHARPLHELLNYGLILLDKPSGPTSHQVVAWVKRILGIEKAGHSGTLDPLVTGLLPIGLGDGTKVLSVLLLGPKEYYAIGRLHSSVPDHELQRVLQEFEGEIYQRPPQRASVKRITRTRHIYELELVERKGNLLLLRILCQAGTYVRKLIYDMGEVLGPGATMVELRRTRVSQFGDEGQFVKLHDLLDAHLIWKEEGKEEKLRRLIRPIEEATSILRSIYIRDSAVDAICHGAQLAVPGIVSFSKGLGRGELVALYTQKGELVALGRAVMEEEELMEAERGIAVSIERVVMRPNTYPRMWKSRKEGGAG